MQLKKITAKFKHFADTLKYGSSQEIHSEKHFFHILERERERANRNNQPFSLVAIDLRFMHPFPSATGNFIKKISHRMREIDEIGWYKQRQIGILLPYTDFQGAGKFVESLKSLFGSKMPIVNYTVFTYPDDNRIENINEELKRTG